MKKMLILLMVCAFATTTYGQKKKKGDEQLDSITKANAALVMKNDSLSKSMVAYQAMYDTLKTGYFKKQFDPAKTAVLMDSLLKTSSPNVDSLLAKNAALAAQVDSLSKMPAATEADRQQIIADLRSVKALLDEGVITQEEFLAVKQKYLSRL